MDEKEKIASYMAMCKCCLMAEAMKTCPRCLFNIGLLRHEEPVEYIPFLIIGQSQLLLVSE